MSEPDHERVLQFVLQHRKPFVSTSDPVEEFDTVGQRTIRERLHDLVDRGDLEMEKVGPNANVWYPPVDHVEDARASSPASESQ